MLLVKSHLLYMYLHQCVPCFSVPGCLFVMRIIRNIVLAAVSRLLIRRLLCVNFKELGMYNLWLLGGFCRCPSCTQLLIGMMENMTWK